MNKLPKNRKVAILQNSKFYFTGKLCKHGHIEKRYTKSGKCIDCNEQHNKRHSLEYYKNNKDGCLKLQLLYRNKNRKELKKKKAKQYTDNKKVYNIRSSKNYKNNKERYVAKNALYRAAKLNRKPLWLTNDDKTIIKDMYAIASRVSKETGIEHHVDHVIPLQGELISGLHVPNNLQLLTANFNLSKGNHFAVN